MPKMTPPKNWYIFMDDVPRPGVGAGSTLSVEVTAKAVLWVPDPNTRTGWAEWYVLPPAATPRPTGFRKD